MGNKGCGCHEGRKDENESCQVCGKDGAFVYWCKTCNRSVADKRCPYCGLKTQRKKGRD